MTSRQWLGATLGIGLLLPGPLVFLGQQVAIEPRARTAPAEAKREPSIRVNTQLVLVPVTVNDPVNRPVLGLEKENFTIFDNKVEQTISSFAMEDDPIAMGLIFDVSGSMGSLLRESRAAANEFLKTAEPEDEFFLVEFDNEPRLKVPLTRNASEIRYQLLFSKSKGSTALVDGVYLGLNEIKKSKHNRKAMVVISDGEENHSRYSMTEVMNRLRESDTLIYTLGVDGGFMRQLAEQSGGRFYRMGGPFADIARKIGIDLRNRYVLGYFPTDNNRDGRYHRIELKIRQPRGFPQLRAQWRQGYTAPLD